MKYLISTLLLGCVLITGCQSDFGVKKTGMEAWILEREKTSLSSDELSQNSLGFLLREGIYPEYNANPEKILKLLSTELVDTKERNLLSVLIELTYLQAKRCDDEDKAVYYYLSSCIYSYAYLFTRDFETPTSPFEPEYLFTCRFYNYSAAEVFKYITKKDLLFSSNVNMPFLNGFVNFGSFINKLPRKLESYTSFGICYDYTPYGFHSLSRQSGLGVPLVAIGSEALVKHDNGIFDLSKKAYPITLFIEFESPAKGKFNATMEFYDPMKTDTIIVKDKKVPLEIDLSTYLGALLRQGAAYSPIEAMIDTSIMQELKGLYMMSPYDKDKIPVVFVHGVLSYPRTWVQTINTLLKDPEIRKKYQFWLFAYPTGNPVLYNASHLREKLYQAQKQFDPKGDDPNFNNMVIVAHSMGGLLTKTLIQNSEDRILEAWVGDKTLDDFDFTDDEKKLIKTIIFYKRVPFIDRIVFISVPHLGSKMTRWWVAKWAAKLVNLPGKLAKDMYDVNKKILIKSGLKKNDDLIKLTTGVDNLDPDNLALKTIAKIPFAKDVPYHSIIGNDKEAGVPGGTDGIVEYLSAHLDGAESELIVKSGHSAHEKPLAIKEIKRILLEHLQEIKKK